MSKKSVLGQIADALLNKKFTSAIILAAGSGERFSIGSDVAGVKKQFIPILGIPALRRTVDEFEKSNYIDEIIIVTSEDDIETCHEILDGHTSKLTHIIRGGATRQDSAMAGLEVINPKAQFIAIHDGARCLITSDIIDDVVKGAYANGAAAAAEKAVDTVKMADSKALICETIDRDYVWLIKTPQVFLANMYRAGVYSAAKDGAAVTDDCMLVERLGFKIKAVDCGHENIKLTYATDKIIAEAILTAREIKKQQENK